MPDHDENNIPDEFGAGKTESWDDEDVPFRLPRADDEDDETPAYVPPARRPAPRVSPEEEEDDAPLPPKPRSRDPHDLPTMPIPREPGSPDPRQTLPGTGGLDPNPDGPAGCAPVTGLHAAARARPRAGGPAGAARAAPPYPGLFARLFHRTRQPDRDLLRWDDTGRAGTQRHARHAA